MHHIYTGDGKGKTTAAVGLAVRCAGSGRRVLFTQFLKPAKSGEIEAMEDMENMQIWLCPAEFGFTWQMTDEEKEEAKDIYERYIWDITRMVLQGNFSMLVMDEVIGACNAGLANEDELREMLEQFPDDMEVVLTGRNPSEQLCEWADYLTEMKKIKHPFDQGVKARKGIEY